MIIGILSDTHDNLPLIEKAVAFFNQQRIDFVLHAGDFVAPFVIDKLAKLQCEWLGVYGNNDGEKKGLAEKSGGRITEGPLRKAFDGRTLTLVHDKNSLETQTEKADIIVFGHTHKPEIESRPGRLFVNPGECSGWLTGKATVATIDTAALTATIHNL